MRALDCGLTEVGRAADFVFMDRAAAFGGQDAARRACGLETCQAIGMTVIDGIVRSHRSRNTPPAERVPVVVAT